ncbi:MerR family transcriptional regulator [Desulfitobacterium sp. Sab5]|uniref:MerR family transcriptional regulator n=1 Tax=Desulfitobacterium nosdiversum TaxID=3375356 RepID=UPI003CF80149
MLYSPKQVAKMAQINVETLRYYEQNGVLPSPVRDKNGYRLYDDDTIEKLETVKYAKTCGLTLKETKEIFVILEDKNIDYNSIIEFINKKTNEINRKIANLNKMKEIFDKIKTNIAIETKCPIKTTLKNL